MIHPMDGVTQDELDEFGDYFGLMRDNLNSLRAAMELLVTERTPAGGDALSSRRAPALSSAGDNGHGRYTGG